MTITSKFISILTILTFFVVSRTQAIVAIHGSTYAQTSEMNKRFKQEKKVFKLEKKISKLQKQLGLSEKSKTDHDGWFWSWVLSFLGGAAILVFILLYGTSSTTSAFIVVLGFIALFAAFWGMLSLAIWYIRLALKAKSFFAWFGAIGATAGFLIALFSVLTVGSNYFIWGILLSILMGLIAIFL
jgi:hypothetical protein